MVLGHQIQESKLSLAVSAFALIKFQPRRGGSSFTCPSFQKKCCLLFNNFNTQDKSINYLMQTFEVASSCGLDISSIGMKISTWFIILSSGLFFVHFCYIRYMLEFFCILHQFSALSKAFCFLSIFFFKFHNSIDFSAHFWHFSLLLAIFFPTIHIF